MQPIKNLRPFTCFCTTIGELPTSYLESMTYYEQVNWLCNYLEKTVIPTVNNNANAVTELQSLFNELKNYVDNYFDNLDVQNEIDHKLDQMVTDGTIENILNNYANIEKVYTTYQDLINDNNLQIGQKFKTLGYYEIGDNGEGNYILSDVAISNKFDMPYKDLHMVLLNNSINVKQFGAYGDGNHDDTSSFKRAIAYLQSLNTYAVPLAIPTGSYLISETLTIPLNLKIYSTGAVLIKYTGENSLLKLIPHPNIDKMLSVWNAGQNVLNIGNVLDGSQGVITLQGNGRTGSQTGIELGGDTLGTNWISHTSWCNFTNLCIERFNKGIELTNKQVWGTRFYNTLITYCEKAITDKNTLENSGEQLNFIACGFNNNGTFLEVNHNINYTFSECNIDYNDQGVLINYIGGYYKLDFANCFIEGNNKATNNQEEQTYLVKSNNTNNVFMPTLNFTNCYIYLAQNSLYKQFIGIFKLNLENCTYQGLRYPNTFNSADSEFICDNKVVVLNWNDINFVANPALISPNLIINENWNFANAVLGTIDSAPGFEFPAVAGDSNATVSDAHYYTSNQSIQIATNDTHNAYKTIRTTKFSVLKYKKITSNLLMYVPNYNEGANQISIVVKCSFFDSEGNLINTVVNNDNSMTVPINNVDKFIALPNGLTNQLKMIDVPNNAYTAQVIYQFGAIKTPLYIDNIAVVGL